jgi:hypothetical protein
METKDTNEYEDNFNEENAKFLILQDNVNRMRHTLKFKKD